MVMFIYDHTLSGIVQFSDNKEYIVTKKEIRLSLTISREAGLKVRRFINQNIRSN